MNWNAKEFIWVDWLVMAIGILAIVWLVYRAIKKDKENHGIGTRSIAATAADYGGVMRIDPRGGMFVIRIIFQPPYTNQEKKTTS